MLDFEFNVSDDRKTASVRFAPGGESDSGLTAQDLEHLISRLSEVRQMLAPDVRRSEPLSQDGHLEVDSFSPDLRVLQEPLSVGERVLLAVAFHGLGWRTIALQPSDAQELGRRLLTLSAQGPQN